MEFCKIDPCRKILSSVKSARWDRFVDTEPLTTKNNIFLCSTLPRQGADAGLKNSVPELAKVIKFLQYLFSSYSGELP
jgi:hypothetical protein